MMLTAAMGHDVKSNITNSFDVSMLEQNEMQFFAFQSFQKNVSQNSLVIDNRVVIIRGLVSSITAKICVIWRVIFLVMAANQEAAAYKASTHLLLRLGDNVKAVSASSTSFSF